MLWYSMESLSVFYVPGYSVSAVAANFSLSLLKSATSLCPHISSLYNLQNNNSAKDCLIFKSV